LFCGPSLVGCPVEIVKHTGKGAHNEHKIQSPTFLASPGFYRRRLWGVLPERLNAR
jgi:hypothetical protein